MSVVTLLGYTPLQRFDATAWTSARLEEAAAADGPWTAIETFTLSPVDADPENPATRDFTSSLATLDQGWYRIVWTDAALHESATPAVQNIDTTLEYEPLVNDVAAEWLRARTKDSNGNELGAFTADTRPTYEQAARVARSAARDLELAIGSDIPDTLDESARSITGLLTAMKIELSFFSDQVAANRSPYTELKALYDDQLPLLKAAVAALEQGGDEATGEVASGLAIWSGPPVGFRAPGAEFVFPGWPYAPDYLYDIWLRGCA